MHLNPSIPIALFPQHETRIIDVMRQIALTDGIRHFMITAPDKTLRLTGFADDEAYVRIGETIQRVKQALAQDDIRISWWNCCTISAGPGAPFTLIKGLGNGESESAYCPLDPGFRDVFINRCRLVAEIAHPAMILFEDDYQFSNHGPVRFGCFCERHLAEFARHAGRAYSLEQLEQIFREVNPTSLRLRRLHAEMMRDGLAGLAAETAGAVQTVSPETRLGLCQPACWALDGDMTEAVTRAFAGNRRPYVRLCGASYGEDHPAFMPAELYTTLYSAQRLADDIDRYYEADTFPHSRFFCSSAMLESMATLALSYGCDDLQLYALHYLPDPLIETGYLTMYRTNRARFQTLRAAVRNSRVSGIEIVSRADAGMASAWTDNGIADTGLRGGYLASLLFSRLGIPYTSRDGVVKALIGDATPRILSERDLLDLLAGPLLIDGAALRVLAERGLGALAGVEVAEDRPLDFNMEIVRDIADFRDLAGQTIYSMAYLNFGVEKADIVATRALPGTGVLTDYALWDNTRDTPDPRRPGILRCVNRLGGRIVVLSSSLDTRASNLYGYQKRDLLRRLFRWLSPESMPAAVRDQPNVSLTANIDRQDRTLTLTLINLCSDTATRLSLDMAPVFTGWALEVLDGSDWRTADHSWDDTRLEVRETFPLLKPQIMRLRE